jgi:hypothetical protein
MGIIVRRRRRRSKKSDFCFDRARYLIACRSLYLAEKYPKSTIIAISNSKTQVHKKKKIKENLKN